MPDPRTRLTFAHALLPGGWAADVAVEVEGGIVRAVEAGAAAGARGIALPGVPNVHSHAFQRGMAGLTERRGPGADSFWSWRVLMYAFLDRLDPDDVEAIAAQAYLEMLEAGFTAVGEFHYLHHAPDGAPYGNLAEMAERIAAAATRTGIGLTLLPSLYATATFGGAPPEPGQRRFVNDAARFRRLLEGAEAALRGLPDAVLGVAPHSLRAVTPELLAEAAAARPAGPIHIHAAEQVREVEDCVAWSGLRPVEWLLAHAELDRRWCVIHATHMNTAETAGLARSEAVAGLCPLTEASLGDGIFNGPEYRAAGGRLGLGTDSNVEITLAGEAKMLEYAQRLARRARNALTLREGESTGRILFDAAAAGGAQALGRGPAAIAPGAPADLLVLDASRPEMAAVQGDRWLDMFAFVLGTSAVDRVYRRGELLVEGGRHRDREAVAARFARVLARLVA